MQGKTLNAKKTALFGQNCIVIVCVTANEDNYNNVTKNLILCNTLFTAILFVFIFACVNQTHICV